MNRRAFELLLGALVLGVGGLLAVWIRDTAPEPPPVPARAPAIVSVEWRRMQAMDVPLAVEGYGTLLARRTAHIAPEIGGRLVRVLETWREGRRVREGEELFAVDSAVLELQLGRAQALAEQCRVELTRARLSVEQAAAALPPSRERHDALAREEARMVKLFEQGHARESQVDQALAARTHAELTLRDAEARSRNSLEGVRVAQALLHEREQALALARTQLEKVATRAPFDGRLVGRAPAVGSAALAGAPLCQLEDLSVLHLRIHVAEDQLPGMEVGLPAEVSLPSLPGLLLPGRVGAIGVQADPLTRTIPVEVDVEQPEQAGAENSRVAGGLAAGQFAAVRIELQLLQGALVVAREELVYRGGRPVVYLIAETPEGAYVEAREVELAESVDAGRVVRSGLAPGDRLITSPLALLSPGAAVAPLDVDSTRAAESGTHAGSSLSTTGE